MSIEIRNNTLRLSSGKIITCYGGVTGISMIPSLSLHKVHHGQDGSVRTRTDPNYEEDYDVFKLTDSECIELAEYMISVWTDYINKIKQTTV